MGWHRSLILSDLRGGMCWGHGALPDLPRGSVFQRRVLSDLFLFIGQAYEPCESQDIYAWKEYIY